MNKKTNQNDNLKSLSVVSQDGRVFGLYLYHFLKLTGRTGLVSWSPKGDKNAPMYLYSVS